MPVEIITAPLELHLYGFSGRAVNRDYAATGFKLMNGLWPEIKSKGLKHKGINIWVYEKNDEMFTGVELEQTPVIKTILEEKKIILEKYASYKHVGSYKKLGEAYANMEDELRKKGLAFSLPYLEIYGHWTDDETKLETTIIFSLK